LQPNFVRTGTTSRVKDGALAAAAGDPSLRSARTATGAAKAAISDRLTAQRRFRNISPNPHPVQLPVSGFDYSEIGRNLPIRRLAAARPLPEATSAGRWTTSFNPDSLKFGPSA
jgi:hypothetical protein